MRHRQVLHSRRETGSVLVVALLLMVLLSLLGVTLLTVAATEHNVAYNALWSEGALMAADAGVNRGLNQLSANATNALRRFPDSANGTIAIGGVYSYRSGPRAAAGPQALQFVSTRTEEGYSIAQCTGYNPCGYVFHTYQITATGTGPRNARREVDIQAEYGPVAQ